MLSELIGINLDVSAEFNDLCVFGPLKLEGITVLKPVVRNLYLITVLYLLLEHSVSVTDAAAVCAVAKGGQRIEEAGRKPSETSVAESRISLLILNHVDIYPELIQSLCNLLILLQADKAVSKGSPHQKLHGKIIYGLRILLVVSLLGVHPVLDYRILYGEAYSLEYLLLARFFKSLSVKALDIVYNFLLEGFLIKLLYLFFSHLSSSFAVRGSPLQNY